MGRNRLQLEEKEKLFCDYFISCSSAREAAARAGFAFPERTAMKLLGTPRVRDELNKLTKEKEKDSCLTLVKNGLRRLAFGSVADAVSLAFFDEPPSSEQLEKMDLFCVSEIKRPKSGGVEIKFFNRLDALKMLLEMGQGDEDDSGIPFFEALKNGAKALSAADETKVL